MEIKFDLKPYLKDKDKDSINFVFFNNKFSSEYQISYNIIDYLDYYIKNKYNMDIGIRLNYGHYTNITIPKLELDFEGYTLSETQIIEIAKDALNTALRIIDYFENIYHGFTNIVKSIQDYKPFNTILYYAEFYNKVEKLGDLNNYKFNDDIFGIQNNVLSKEPIEEFNRLSIDFYLTIRNINLNKYYNFLNNTELRKLIKDYFTKFQGMEFNYFYRNLFKEYIKNNLLKEINIENSNIRNYHIYFYVEKTYENLVIDCDAPLNGHNVFDISIDLLYKGELNFNYLYLDKIIKAFRELAEIAHLQPLLQVV